MVAVGRHAHTRATSATNPVSRMAPMPELPTDETTGNNRPTVFVSHSHKGKA